MLDPTAHAVYELPGAEIASLEAFWVVIGEVINGPGGYFGWNLDAFRDCLRGGFGTPDIGFTLCWLDSEKSRVALGYTEAVRQLTARLGICHPSARAQVTWEIREAEQGRGLTVFDWLVGIIAAEPTVTLELLHSTVHED